MRQNVFFCLVLVLLSSCQKSGLRQKSKNNGATAQQIIGLNVPTPLCTAIISYDVEEKVTGRDVSFCFETTLDPEELSRFYERHMELYGWQQVKKFDASDKSLLQYEMPMMLCSLFFQTCDNKQRVYVFIGAKERYNDE